MPNRTLCNPYGVSGSRVRLWRALAYRVGVDRSTVGRWEAGETDPQPCVRRKLAKHLGVTAQELLDAGDGCLCSPRRCTSTWSSRPPR
ncbi:helix-turn-helix domain-containing protein [Pseudonocardia sp. TRM90224]|uniref:helix-turn-helix domain-containing protein n=1 Tax=Pseudonocardia sp. TRM90224 TaxID=2812678 RepID=UPI001E61361C|nr:helix-turn-helix transcriptional regulator [Pseudonocardia sp. TRM90224]